MPNSDGLTNVEQAVRAAGEDSNDGDEDDNFRNMDWKQDVGERSRRVYDWWRTVMLEKSDEIPHFQKAVMLAVLAQPSSAAVERVFSQLTFIRRAVGDLTTRDVMELRAFIRCNNNLLDDFVVNGA